MAELVLYFTHNKDSSMTAVQQAQDKVQEIGQDVAMCTDNIMEQHSLYQQHNPNVYDEGTFVGKWEWRLSLEEEWWYG